MKSYKFKDYLFQVETFTIPERHKGNVGIQSILLNVPQHDILEFAIEVASSVLNLTDAEMKPLAENCINAAKACLDNPEYEGNNQRARNAVFTVTNTFNATDASSCAALSAANAARAGYWVNPAHVAVYFASCGERCAHYAAMARYLESNQDGEYNHAITEYASWAKARLSVPKLKPNNTKEYIKQELMPLLNEPHPFLPAIVDKIKELEEKFNMKLMPSLATLKDFNVKKPANMIQNMEDARTVKGFIDAIKRSLR